MYIFNIMNEIFYFFLFILLITFIVLYFQSDNGHGERSIPDTFTKFYTEIILPIYNSIVSAFVDVKSDQKLIMNIIVLIVGIGLIVLFFMYAKTIGNLITRPFSDYISTPISNLLSRLFTPVCSNPFAPIFPRSMYMFTLLIFLVLIILFYIFYLKDTHFVQTDELNIASPIICLLYTSDAADE